ncbi:hypothetical protein CDAR_29991, partial [Caerostris darwini]
EKTTNLRRDRKDARQGRKLRYKHQITRTEKRHSLPSKQSSWVVTGNHSQGKLKTTPHAVSNLRLGVWQDECLKIKPRCFPGPFLIISSLLFI